MIIPKHLYHATAEKNWESIKQKGLKPYFPAVYMTDDIKAAEFFANGGLFGTQNKGMILKIDTSHLREKKMGTYREMLCDIIDTTDFYHYYGTIRPQYIERMSDEQREAARQSNK